MVSESQLGFMGALFTEKGFPNDSKVRHTYEAAVVDHPVASGKDLTMAEARAVITALQAEEPFDTSGDGPDPGADGAVS